MQLRTKKIKTIIGLQAMQELIKIGSNLGADVPYCLMGQTQLAEGIGDVLTILPVLPATYSQSPLVKG